MQTLKSSTMNAEVKECFYVGDTPYVVVSSENGDSAVPVEQSTYDAVCVEMWDANALPLNIDGVLLIGFADNYDN